MNWHQTAFLSHASEDKSRVIELAQKLRAGGILTWLDKDNLDPGVHWPEEINDAIKKAQFFIPCFSRNSVTKEGYVREEFKMALEEQGKKSFRSIYFIPVLLDDVEMPDITVGNVKLRDFHACRIFEETELQKLIIHLNKQIDSLKEKITGNALNLLKNVMEKGEVELDKFIEHILDINGDDAISLLREQLFLLDENTEDEKEKSLLTVLQSFFFFFSSHNCLLKSNDIVQAIEYIEQAKNGFESERYTAFESLAESYYLYYSALLDFRNMNMADGNQKLAAAKKLLYSMDIYGHSQLEAFSDVIESERLFFSGLDHFAPLDYEKGTIDMAKAGHASIAVAHKHFGDDLNIYNQFIGLGWLYQARSELFVQSHNLSILDLDYFAESINKASEFASKAAEFLRAIWRPHAMINLNLKNLQIIKLLSAVNYKLANLLLHLIEARKTFPENDIRITRLLIKEAQECAIELGEENEKLLFVRASKDLRRKLENIERKLLQQQAKHPAPYSHQKESPALRLIEEGKIPDALDYMADKTNDAHMLEELILLKGDLLSVMEQKVKGKLSPDISRIKETEILTALMNRLDRVG